MICDERWNPLKYINPELFEEFKQLKSVEEIDFSITSTKSSCINENFKKSSQNDINSYKWNSENCSDLLVKHISKVKTENRKTSQAYEDVIDKFEKNDNEMHKFIKMELMKKLDAIDKSLAKIQKENDEIKKFLF